MRTRYPAEIDGSEDVVRTLSFDGSKIFPVGYQNSSVSVLSLISNHQPDNNINQRIEYAQFPGVTFHEIFKLL